MSLPVTVWDLAEDVAARGRDVDVDDGRRCRRRDERKREQGDEEWSQHGPERRDTTRPLGLRAACGSLSSNPGRSLRKPEFRCRATASPKPPADARKIAEDLGAPTVIKSQVLTGGRMKAGGVKFADTPDEAERHAADILELEINGHMPRGVLVDSRVEVAQEYYAGVTWDGTRKRPVLIFSDMGGIDIEEVAESHPDHVGRAHFSTLRPFGDYEAKQVIASVGVTGRALTRLDADPLPARPAVPPVRHDAGRDQPARAARGRLVRRRRRPHGHGERGAAAAEGDPEGARRRRRGDAPGPRGDAVRARRRGRRPAGPPRRGRQRDRVRRRPRARDRRRRRLADAVRRRPRARRQARQLLRDRRQPVGREGLRPGQARAPEAGRGQDRGDDVDRLQHPGRHRRPRRDQGVRRARLRPGGEDLDLPHPRGVGGGRLQDPREVRGQVRRPQRVSERGRAAGGGRREHPASTPTPRSSSRASPAARPST